MPTSLIGLGANLGDRRAALAGAVEALRSTPGVVVRTVSRWRETAPVGGPAGQPAFLNGAARLETTLAPLELLAVLRSIERRAGRERSIRWNARTLDLDLLLYDEQTLDTPELTLPHPRMAFRRFVLEPAAEVAGDLMHPTILWTVRQLLDHLDTAAEYVAVTGTDFAPRRVVADRIAERCGGRLLALHGGAGFPPEGDDCDDSTGPTLPAAIESLDLARQVLSPTTFADGCLVVSDFWWGEMPSAAKFALTPDECRSYEEAWRQAREHVVAPKLIVAVGMSSGADADDERRERFRQALRERLAQPRQAPVLHVPADVEAATEEATAAVAAMR